MTMEPLDPQQAVEKDDNSPAHVPSASIPLKLLAPKLAPPSAKSGLAGLPTELLLGLVTSFLLLEDSPETCDRLAVLHLMKTCRRMYTDLKEVFYKNAFDDDARGHYLLRWACVHGQKPLLENSLSRPNIDVNKPDGSGCVKIDYPSHIPERPPENACPSILNRWGMTPLHLAVICQRREIVKVLIRHSAEIDLQDHYGRTPLTYATEEGQVAMLLEAGASPVKEDRKGLIPLAHLVSEPWFRRAEEKKPEFSLAAFRRLLAATRRASPTWNVNARLGNIQDCKSTLLRIAVQAGPEQACALLKAGANPNGTPDQVPVPDTWFSSKEELPTPLQLASDEDVSRSLDTMKLLVEFGARVDEVANGLTALTKTIKRLEGDADDRGDIVTWLIQEAGADPNMFAEVGAECDSRLVCCADYGHFLGCPKHRYSPRSPLYRAVVNAQEPAMVERLIKLGADARRAANNLALWARLFQLYHYPIYQIHKEYWTILGNVAKVLVANGADIHQTTTRTSWYIDDGTDTHRSARPRKRRPAISTLRVEQWRNNRERRKFHFQSIFEPRLGRCIYSIKSADSPDLQKMCVRKQSRHANIQDLRMHRLDSKWSLLDEAMLLGDRDRVEAVLRSGFNPLHNLTHSSQMRNTALGKLIRSTNFCYTKRSFMGPWTAWEWGKAEFYLKFCGPAVTAKFPLGLLAQLLAQAVVRIDGMIQQKMRIFQFERLTNHNNRWGRRGGYRLEALVKHPAYWYLFDRPRHLGGYFARYEKPENMWYNLWQAANIVCCLSKGSSYPSRISAPAVPWFVMQDFMHPGHWIRRSRYQPLPETEYRCAFAVLFGEQTSPKIKSRRKARGKRKGARAA